MSEEVDVARVERGDGNIRKVPYQYGSGHTYAYDVVFTLVDGRQVTWTEKSRLLRDAKRELAAIAPEGMEPVRPVAIVFNDEGEPWVKRETYGLLAGSRR